MALPCRPGCAGRIRSLYRPGGSDNYGHRRHHHPDPGVSDMHIMIFGGAGMIGRKLAERLGKDGRLGEREVAHLTLVDVVAGAPPPGLAGKTTLEIADVSAPGGAARCIAQRPDVIFHLAAIVSGEA